MSEGRKGWMDPITGRIVADGQDFIDATFVGGPIEVAAFTLPELAARDARIKNEWAIPPEEAHAQGFAAGVEAAASRMEYHAKSSAEHGYNLSHPFQVLAKEIRALLPPNYKSPAQIRREALEEIKSLLINAKTLLKEARSIYHEESVLGMTFDSAKQGCIGRINSQLRALAEAGGGE